MDKTLYKKDLALIKELQVRFSRVYGYILLVISVIFTSFYVATSFFVDDFQIGIVALVSCYMPMLVDILILNGTTPLTGINKKNAAASREMVKGSGNQLDTLYCIPVRKESVFRFQFSNWLLTTAVTLYPALFAAVCGIMGHPISVISYIMFFASILYRIIMFFTIYAVAFHSKTASKIITVLYMAGSISCPLIITVGSICTLAEKCAKIIELALNAPKNYYAPSVILLVLCIVIVPAMYAVYKKVILKRTGGGWYE